MKLNLVMDKIKKTKQNQSDIKLENALLMFDLSVPMVAGLCVNTSSSLCKSVFCALDCYY